MMRNTSEKNALAKVVILLNLKGQVHNVQYICLTCLQKDKNMGCNVG